MQQASLEQLNDIVEPGAASLWPPAWPVVALALGLLVAITVTLWWLWRQYRRRRPQRVALTTLHNLQRPAASDITLLCKRVALVYFPREQVAELNGRSWLQFLGADEQLTQQHNELLYKAGNNDLIEQYKQLAMAWIKRAHRSAKQHPEPDHV